MTQILQVVTTTDSREEAERLARGLVDARIAACVQVDGPIQSTYWWEGRATTEEEWRLTIKTIADRYDELEGFIARNHSYDTPEVLATPVTRGSEDYMRWVVDETAATTK